ncbi:hypothetical protein GGX14DRAFT_562756 [Mycena pura]|uniref:Uncharacterized protein n=1 Tax=Mycena pura TaxID=153505 RepID=A0AAD6YEQ0_9AGAR|nr:hypothetical protein GGX14DRAFT_562756 [Mycena pura]
MPPKCSCKVSGGKNTLAFSILHTSGSSAPKFLSLAALNTPDPSGRPTRTTTLCTWPPSLFHLPHRLSRLRTERILGRTCIKQHHASARAAALLASHKHQDLQELLFSECVREENARVGREGTQDRAARACTAGTPACQEPDRRISRNCREINWMSK